MCSVSLSCPSLCDPMDCIPPGSLSLEFSRQEYWSGLHFLLQVVMYIYANWTIQKAECQRRIDAFKLWYWRRLENPLDCKIKRVNPKGNQSWIFIGRTDAETETPIFWPPDVKSRLTGKDPDAGKDWRQEEKGRTEDKMVAWHPWLDGHEFEQAPGIGDGQGSLACCSPCGRKESHPAERLNWTENGGGEVEDCI